MELKLKHIAPYLPYGLRCVANNDLEIQTGIDAFDVVEKKGAVMCLSYISDEICGYDIVGVNYKVSDSFTHNIYSSLSPLLLPLSALTETLLDETVPLKILFDTAFGLQNFSAITFKNGLYAIKAIDKEDDMMVLSYNVKEFCFQAHNIDLETRETRISIVPNQLQLFEYLFANHFDVFGLIDAGLAIDKRTIK